MRKAIWIVGLCSLVVMGACATEPDDESTSDEYGELTEVEGRKLVSELPSDEDIASQEGTVDKAGCVYVEWCNEPGPWGTICQVENYSCSWSQIVNECYVDARYVCGSIVEPLGIDF
jgi:hypothetical protein